MNSDLCTKHQRGARNLPIKKSPRDLKINTRPQSRHVCRMVSAMHRSRRQLLASHDLAFRLTRTSPTPPDRDTVVQRANPFASAVNDVARRGERITLLTTRTERETLSYIITPGQGSNSHVVTSLATALGAKATQVDSMSDISEVLDTPFSSFLVARPSKNASFATQSGGDRNEVAVLLGRLLQPRIMGGLTLRKPSESERNRTRKWFEHRREANSSPTTRTISTHSWLASSPAVRLSKRSTRC